MKTKGGTDLVIDVDITFNVDKQFNVEGKTTVTHF
jgi:ribosomal protein L11